MECTIDINKLLFLQKLISLDCSHLAKHVFLYRLAEHIMLADTDINMRGFLPEVVCILRKYGLVETLENYCLRAEFPRKETWKRIVKHTTGSEQSDLYKEGLIEKGADRVVRVHSHLQPFSLYSVARRNPLYKHQILRLVKLLTIPVSLACCPLCYKISSDMVQHVLVYCEMLSGVRNQMWDELTDLLGVRYARILFKKTDAEVTVIFLGGLWELDGEPDLLATRDLFRCCVANTFHQIFQILKDYS